MTAYASARYARAMLTHLALFIVLRQALPAHAGFVARGTSPAGHCNAKLTRLAPASIDELERLLRWVGLLDPAMDEAIASESDWRRRLTILNLGTAFTVASKAPGSTSRPEYLWFHNKQNLLDLQSDRAERERRRLLGESWLPGRRSPIVDRWIGNLRRVRAAIVGEGKTSKITIRNSYFTNTVLLDLSKDTVRALEPVITTTLAALEDERLVAMAREFMILESAPLARHYTARAALATCELASRRERLEADVAARRAEVEDLVTAFCRAEHRRPPPPPSRANVAGEARPPTVDEPFDAAAFVRDPARTLHRGDQPVSAREVEREVHAVCAGLNQIMLRAPGWDEVDAEWSRWADTISADRAWISAFLDALEHRRRRAFALMTELESGRAEVDLVRDWAARQRAMVAERNLGARAQSASARVGDMADRIATAVEVRARVEDELLNTIHELEALISGHLRERLAGAPGRALPEEIAVALRTLATRSGAEGQTSR